jgi:hypothetical protein
VSPKRKRLLNYGESISQTRRPISAHSRTNQILCRPDPGKQRILTPDGYKIPLKYRNGLPYMDITYPTTEDIETYPHVYFTKDSTWDPTILDDEYESELSETEEDELTYNSEIQ